MSSRTEDTYNSSSPELDSTSSREKVEDLQNGNVLLAEDPLSPESSHRTASPTSTSLQEDKTLVNFDEAGVDNENDEGDESAVEETSPTKLILQRHWMLIFGFFLAYSSMGIGLSVVGPTMIQIGRQINEESTSKLSMSYMGRAVGFFIGSFTGGQILDRCSNNGSQWALIWTVFLTGVTVAMFPFVTNLFQFIMLSTLSAVVMGMVDNFVQLLLIRLCGDHVGPFLQALHSGFAVGAFISPLVASIFIEDDETSVTYKTAFFVLGIVTTVITGYLVVLIFLRKGPADSIVMPPPPVEAIAPPSADDNEAAMEAGPNSEDESESLNAVEASPAKTSARNYSGSIPIIVGGIGFMLFFYVGTETAIGSFLATYAFRMDLLTESKAASLTSAYWGMFAAGRLLGIPLSLVFSEAQLIASDIFLSLVALILIMIFPDSVGVLWFSTCLIGLAVASLYAAAVSFLEKAVVLSGQMLSIIVGLVASSEALFPFVVGLSFDLPSGPLSMMYISLSAIFLCSCVFASLYVYRKKHTPVIDATSTPGSPSASTSKRVSKQDEITVKVDGSNPQLEAVALDSLRTRPNTNTV